MTTITLSLPVFFVLSLLASLGLVVLVLLVSFIGFCFVSAWRNKPVVKKDNFVQN